MRGAVLLRGRAAGEPSRPQVPVDERAPARKRRDSGEALVLEHRHGARREARWELATARAGVDRVPLDRRRTMFDAVVDRGVQQRSPDSAPATAGRHEDAVHRPHAGILGVVEALLRHQPAPEHVAQSLPRLDTAPADCLGAVEGDEPARRIEPRHLVTQQLASRFARRVCGIRVRQHVELAPAVAGTGLGGEDRLDGIPARFRRGHDAQPLSHDAILSALRHRRPARSHAGDETAPRGSVSSRVRFAPALSCSCGSRAPPPTARAPPAPAPRSSPRAP